MEIHSEKTVPLQDIMEWFVRKALKLGWTRDENGMLINLNHPSHNWCAEWGTYKVNGVTYTVPHWLPKVVDEQLEALIPKTKNKLLLKDLDVGEVFTLPCRKDKERFVKTTYITDNINCKWQKDYSSCFIPDNQEVERFITK